LWGSSPYGFSFWPSVGASGGLLTMWDSAEVEISYSLSFDHVLAVGGRFLHCLEDFVVLMCLLRVMLEVRLCCGGLYQPGWSPLWGKMYVSFIDDNDFVDLHLIGHRFTWYRGDSRSMSRLDRFLLSDSWCARWPNCIQVAQLRGLSDHCALVLSVDEQNWGRRPFRMLKCWTDIPGYKEFVSSK